MHYSTSIGLDVHARSISASAFVWETGEVVSREFGYEPGEVAEWARSLPQPAGCLYESGPTGFDLKRKLEALGVPCHVGAVTKMVRPSGDRVKTDKRDARFLSRLLAVGDFAECRMPTARTEAARDLSRAREDAREDLMRARHRLSKFLLRYGFVWPRGKASWTKEHRRWLRSIELPDPTAQLVLGEYMERARECEGRRDRLDRAIAERAGADDLAPLVRRLECLRGVSLVTAFGIAAEIGDFGRFPTARSLMSYVGLVPSESSSGETTSRGRITKCRQLPREAPARGERLAPREAVLARGGVGPDAARRPRRGGADSRRGQPTAARALRAPEGQGQARQRRERGRRPGARRVRLGARPRRIGGAGPRTPDSTLRARPRPRRVGKLAATLCAAGPAGQARS